MKIRKIVSNIEVNRHSRFSDYAVSCEYAGARYHIWVHRETREIQQGLGNAIRTTQRTLFKNPPLGTDRKSPEYFASRKLDADSPTNATIVRQMMDYANSNKLFDKADESICLQEKANQEQSRIALRKQNIELHAGELFVLLQDVLPWVEAYLQEHSARLDSVYTQSKLQAIKALVSELS